MSPHDEIVISGLGLHSSLGGIRDAAAAFRCGLSRARELSEWPYFDEETRNQHLLTGHPAALMNDGFQGTARMLKMSIAAVADLQRRSRGLDEVPQERTGLCIAFSGTGLEEASTVQRDGAGMAFISALRRKSDLLVDDHHLYIFFEERIGVMLAIHEAIARLARRELDACIVGAVDTLLLRQRLGDLVAAGRVKTVDLPVGLMPGEAACFMLLEPRAQSLKRGARMGVQISSVAALREPAGVPENTSPEAEDWNEEDSDQGASDEGGRLPTGREMAEVMVQALRDAGAAPDEMGDLYPDLNGEVFRAADLGNALIRTALHYALHTWSQSVPAMSFGDTGSCSGLLAVSMAARAMTRGYARGRHALIVSASDAGGYAAVNLNTVNHGTS